MTASGRSVSQPELSDSVVDEDSVSHDAVFNALSNERRRYTLHYLNSVDYPVSVGELAEQIAAWENSVSRNRVTAAQRKRVYTALQQFHLDKMVDAELVRYERRDGMVELAFDSDSIDIYLDIVESDNIPWSTYYTGLSVLSAGFVLCSVVGIPPFPLLDNVVSLVVVVGVFVLSSICHLYLDSKYRLGDFP